LINCPNCDAEVEEGERVCPNCGYALSEGRELINRSRVPIHDGVGGHLSTALSVALSNPIVFIPSLVGGLISSIVEWVSYNGGYTGFQYFTGVVDMGFILMTSSRIFIDFLSFASLVISRDAYFEKSLNLEESITYFRNNLSKFLVASIIGGLMRLTVLLTPVVIFMFVIIVLEEASIPYSIKKAFRVIWSDISHTILILLISILGFMVCCARGAVLFSILNVLIGLAFIDIYYHYRE